LYENNARRIGVAAARGSSKGLAAMRQQLEDRMKQLRAEFESGQQRLASLEQECQSLRQTLLRISGAIQVLEEELAKDGSPEQGDARGPG
jgi:predicted nuclease with TOPRIM domain